MKQVKCLSILQPWASLCVTGEKRIETRSWNTKYRGKLLIHASMGKQYKKIPSSDPMYKHYHLLFAHHNLPPIEQLPFGAIIGSVDLIKTVKSEDFFTPDESRIAGYEITEQEKAFGDYSPNRFGWLLANPVMFDKLIPAKGKLGIWNYELEE
jgi:activating signal cointegrator 1